MTDSGPLQFPNDEDLERLRRKMNAAKILYQSAKEEHDRSLKRVHALGSGLPDGNMRRALQSYLSSLEHYREATMDFNRYLLDRTFGPSL